MDANTASATEGKPLERLVLIGAGNVGSQLAHQLATSWSWGRIAQIYSPGGESARRLVEELPYAVEAVSDLSEIRPEAEWYVFAAPDAALPELWRELSPRLRSGIWVHLSGATPLAEMAHGHALSAVIYPLMTISRTKSLDWRTVPLYLEASTPEVGERIRTLVRALSPETRWATSRDRELLHVAAVLACNFTNYLIGVSEQFLADHGLPSKALLPLLEEQLEKLRTMPAREAQTGPAIRGDQPTMQRHLALLDSYPELQQLYKELSQRIAGKEIW